MEISKMNVNTIDVLSLSTQELRDLDILLHNHILEKTKHIRKRIMKFVQFEYLVDYGKTLQKLLVSSRLELERRLIEERLKGDNSISNIHRFYKPNWGMLVRFTRKNIDYVCHDYNEFTGKFGIYKYSEEYSLSRSNIKIA